MAFQVDLSIHTHIATMDDGREFLVRINWPTETLMMFVMPDHSKPGTWQYVRSIDDMPKGRWVDTLVCKDDVPLRNNPFPAAA